MNREMGVDNECTRRLDQQSSVTPRWRRIYRRWGKYVIPAITGLVGFGAKEEISLIIKGADIVAEPRSIVFLQDNDDLWKVFLHIRVANTGYTPATMEIKDFCLEFPQISKRPLFFDVDHHLITVPEQKAIDDTLTMRFPGTLFNSIGSYSKFPKPHKGRFQLQSPSGKILATADFDSSGITQTMKFESGEPTTPAHFPGMSHQKEPPQLRIPATLLPVFYEGKRYEVLIYPPSAKATYTIVNGRIRLEISQTFSSSAGDSEQYIAPVRVFPDPAIAEKIDDLPEFLSFELLKEVRSDTKVTYDHLKLFLGNQSDFKQQHVFIFK